MCKLLKAPGAREVELCLLPDQGHGITPALADAELYTWLMKHSRSPAKASKP